MERGPFLLAVGKRGPGQEIGQFLIGLANQRREESGLLDAVLLPQFQRDRLKAFQQRRQPARQTTIDADFVDHRRTSLYLAREVIAADFGAVSSQACNAAHGSRNAAEGAAVSLHSRPGGERHTRLAMT